VLWLSHGLFGSLDELVAEAELGQTIRSRQHAHEGQWQIVEAGIQRLNAVEAIIRKTQKFDSSNKKTDDYLNQRTKGGLVTIQLWKEVVDVHRSQGKMTKSLYLF